MKCDMNCFNCIYEDCINDDVSTLEERNYSNVIENSIKKSKEQSVDPILGMTRYIHNRPDKEAYIKARNKEYEDKRKGRADRVESKKKYYQNHREEKLEYQNNYYETHKEEILAQRKLKYEKNREKVRAYQKEYRRRKREEKEQCKLQSETTNKLVV